MSSTPRSLLDAAEADVGADESVADATGRTEDATSERPVTAVSFEQTSDERGVAVVDPVDRHRYTLRADTRISKAPADTASFLFPVDTATRITTTALSLPTVVPVCVRDLDGTPRARVEHFADQELPAGTYSIEVCAPIRLYVRVESALRVVSDTDRTRIEFGDATPVAIGARSRHERPAATVTTTDEPEDLMAAVSTFGSALATTSPERSYPSFRGHPPLIERGDELDVPDGLDSPETGLRIEVPAKRRAVYTVAPLAYYLGARVVPGPVPKLVADTGFEHRLDGTSLGTVESEIDPVTGFETAVERVLKQTFLLDCVTRTEGIYPVALRERRALAEAIDLDLAALYDWPIAERIEAYLQVPFETVESHLPDWKLTTHLAPEPESVETLPFVANDLAVVRTPRSEELSVSPERAATLERQTDAVDDFLRAPARGNATAATAPDPATYVDPASTDSLESMWVGDGRPLNGGKATTDAYRNRLDREPTEGDIEVTVVCNDIDRAGDGRTGMDDERAAVDGAYGSPLSLPFEITTRHDLTTDELGDVLAEETDFLHYIGHVDERGFECTDGMLDASSLDTVGADAFFLNACRSYDQGMAMLEAGAIGGIVTQIDVVNEGALAIGTAVPRLLNAGFPLGAALEVARGEAVVGERYLVVGDQGLAVTQPESGTPGLCEIERSDDCFEVGFKTYATKKAGMGSMVIPYFDQNEEYFLASGKVDTFTVSAEELREFFSLENSPVLIDGDLHWSANLAIEDI